MMTKDSRKALMAWNPINSRIISATFKTSNRRVKVHIIPTRNTDDQVKDRFYDILTQLHSSAGAGDLIILMGVLLMPRLVAIMRAMRW